MDPADIALEIPTMLRTVQRWVQMWQVEGKDGLRDRKTRNRWPKKTTPEDDDAL